MPIMKRKTKTLLIIAIPAVAIMAVSIAVYCGVWIISALGTDMGLHSDMCELNAGIREELKTRFEQEGCYPENLDVLIPTIVKKCYPTGVPDRLKELDMFSFFKYSNDGNTYTIIWSYKNKYGGTVYTHKEYGRNGTLEKSELYINGQRRNVNPSGKTK